MSRRRFYVPRDSIRDGIARLPPDQAHHLRDVLRMRAGEVVEIFDGAGCEYSGEIDIQASSVYVRNLNSIFPRVSPIRLTLAAALIKSSKFEWMLQKATELGVDEIIPLKTRLSDIEIPDSKIALRLERWNRIVREASKQCRRSISPRIYPPQTFQNFLSEGGKSSCTGFLFYENASESWNPEHVALAERVALCIGPEGGWEDREIEQAKNAGYGIFSLGPWILRAETAAIAALSIIQHQINLLNLKS